MPQKKRIWQSLEDCGKVELSNESIEALIKTRIQPSLPKFPSGETGVKVIKEFLRTKMSNKEFICLVLKYSLDGKGYHTCLGIAQKNGVTQQCISSHVREGVRKLICACHHYLYCDNNTVV